MVRTKQGFLKTSNAGSKEEIKGNSQILNAAFRDQLKNLYPAQVIVRPFNLVSNPKAKEMVAAVQMNRPKERFKYQHNVNGDFDAAQVRDVVLPSTSQSQSILKTDSKTVRDVVLPSTSQSQSILKTDSKTVRLTKTDIPHSGTPTLEVTKKLEIKADEGNPQNGKMPISGGKVVQDVCAGSVTVTNRALKFITSKKVVKVNSFPFEVPKNAIPRSVQHQTVALPNSSSNYQSSIVSLPSSGNSTNSAMGTSLSALQRPQELGSKLDQGSNAVQIGAKNKFQVVNTSVVNGQKFFVCKLINDSPGTTANITTTTTTAATTAIITGTTAIPASVPYSVVPNNSNICLEGTQSVAEKCGTSTISTLKTQVSPSVSSFDVQKSTEKFVEGVKTIHLEILEDRLVQLRKANSTQVPLENIPRALVLNSPAGVGSPPKQITEEQLPKLFQFKKSPNEPLKLIGLKSSVNDMSDISPLVLQPLKTVFKTVPELQPATFCASSSSQDNVQLMNITNEKQRKVFPLSETHTTPMQQKNVVVQNTPVTKTTTENLQVLLQQKIDAQVYQKRKEIALKYQQEVERMKTEKKVVRRHLLPQRTVELMETATQTSLFSIIEPGRFVELSFTERTPAPSSKSGCSSHEKDNSPQRKSASSASVSPLAPSSSKKNELARKRSAVLRTSSREGVQDARDSSYESAEETTSSGTVGESEAAKRKRMDNFCLENRTEKLLNSVGRRERNVNRIALQNINNTVPIPAKSPISPFYNSNNNGQHALGILNDSFSKCEVLSKLNRKQQQQIFKDFKECVVADDVGNIPLHYAVLDEDIQEVKRQCLVLVGRNETLDWVNKDDETPLHLAISSGNVAITKMLLVFKADPAERDAEGNTALHLAVGPTSNVQCLEAVLEYVQRGSELLDAFNDDGYSPLHLCVINAKDKEVKLLIEKGADVNSRDGKSGKTSLFHAVLAKNHMLACILVRLGASTTVPNFSGQTPLSICEMSMLPSLEVACDAMDVDDPLPDKIIPKKPVLPTPGPSCGTKQTSSLPSSRTTPHRNGLSKSLYNR